MCGVDIFNIRPNNDGKDVNNPKSISEVFCKKRYF